MSRSRWLRRGLAICSVLVLLLMPGPAYADLILGDDNNNPNLQGTSGNDEIYGFDGADVAHAKAGNDDVHMGAGNDEGYGGDNADHVWGGVSGGCCSHGDWLLGGSGQDTLEDDQSSDFDLVCGEANDDVIDVSDGDGQDSGYGGGGSDAISQDGGDNVLQGDANCPP